MALQKLLSILKPPLNPVDAEKNNWVSVENKIGTKLPDDYKEFIETYGFGIIDEFLVILNPFVENEFVNLIEEGKGVLEGLQETKKEFPEDFPMPIFPEKNGFLPFAGTDNGDSLFWVTKGEPNQWTIAGMDARSSEVYRFDGSMTMFLYKILKKEEMCFIFPDDPTFEVMDE